MCERCGFTRQPGANPWPEQKPPWHGLPHATSEQVRDALSGLWQDEENSRRLAPRDEDWGPSGITISEQHGRLLVRIGQTETDRIRLDVRDALDAANIPYRSYGSGGLIQINPDE